MRAFVGSLAVGVALACVLSACATDAAYRPLPALRAVQSATALGNGGDVTMYNLITTPERYDGKVVRVIGVGRFEEGFGNENVWALYATRDDLDHVTCALVYVADLVPELQPETPKLGALMDKYVLVTATFRAAAPVPPGVLVMDSCPNASELHSVTSIAPWEFGD